MFLRLLILGLACLCAACADAGAARRAADGTVTLVFKHARHPGPGFFADAIAAFEAEHPGIRVREEILPASSDDQHQFYVINLAAAASDFDVLDMDIVWVPQFARAGWLADLTDVLAPAELAPLHAGALAADRLDGRLYGLPWFIDLGVLYYRRDLLERYGFAPPETFDDLVTQARTVLDSERDQDLMGFVWQGRQYEGLVCVALEFIRGFGGDLLDREGRSALETSEVQAALGLIDDLIHRTGVSPSLVASLDEEGSRLLFQSGRAVFMRNWPYAWSLLDAPGSPVAGRVGLTVMPSASGEGGVPVLGGYHLGVNARSPFVPEATAFVRYLMRREIQRGVALEMGRLPARADLYDEPDVRAALPYLEHIAGDIERARPRPVTPYYLMISQVLQPELSAIVAGIRTPAEAARLATRQIDYLLDLEAR